MLSTLAEHIVSNGLETPATFFLGISRPIAFLLSQTGLVFICPFLELIGIKGYDYVALFSRTCNVEKLMHRIEVLADEKKRSSQDQPKDEPDCTPE